MNTHMQILTFPRSLPARSAVGWCGPGLEHVTVRVESVHEERGFTLQTDAREGSAWSSFRARTEGSRVWPEGEGDTQAWPGLLGMRQP